MKKIKLFACAMLALMCLSFSGCGATSGHDGDRINQLMLARIDDSSTAGTCFYDVNGTKIIPETPSVIYTLTNGIYQFTVAYDPSTVSGGQVTVTLNSEPTSIMNPFGVINKADYPNDENIPLYAINYAPRALAPFMFDKDYLIIPVVFRSTSIVEDNEMAVEIAKHRFVLALEPYASGDDTLVFTLTDKVTDPDTGRGFAMFNYQAFDLRYIVSDFKAMGNTLKKITIKAMTSEDGCDLSYAKEETYTFDYNF